MKVRKAVIPAAGFGTRLLPQTKAMPKEMLPIVDKPIIQRVVEELVEAGIKDIIIVTGYHKRSIEDHFDKPSNDLIKNLTDGGPAKQKMLDELNSISEMANFIYVRQKGPYGNGTPLLNVRHIIGNEPFIYTWSDDFIEASPVSRFRQLINTYDEYQSSVLGCFRINKDVDYDRCGVVAGGELKKGLLIVDNIIEKPGKAKAPSDLAAVSGYLFTPDIFDYLDEAVSTIGEGQELYYVDALKLMLRDKKRILALEIENGKYYDTGNKLEYLKTVVEFGLKHPEIGADFQQFLSSL
ncbi:UTP--glucose-1-phosphate uridylyltransferase [Candidatus Amesbacteria bacterium]|nr:UTP--glucose-1-phosphate uridylyltransferase [Candidatus Amesbacteria bacterium]